MTRLNLALIVLVIVLVPITNSLALETDQFTNRLVPPSDASEILNRKVNESIDQLVADWRWGPDRMKFRFEIYQRLGGRLTIDRLERWVMQSDEIESVTLDREGSIFASVPHWQIWRSAGFPAPLSVTIQVDGNLIGSDKIGHFFSQGLKYFRRVKRTGSITSAAAWAVRSEKGIFGLMSTGTYSNADLVANFEGYLFYRSLFEDNVIAGKPSILEWTGERWTRKRDFDWSDHVNAYWDEAVNVSYFSSKLTPYIEQNLLDRCGDYHRKPEAFRGSVVPELVNRYRHLGFRPNNRLRLENVCAM